MATKVKSHTGFRNGDLFCFNCGRSQKIPFPMEVTLATDFFKSFDKHHKGCAKTWIEPVAMPNEENLSSAIKKNADWWLQYGERGISSETMFHYLSGRRIGQRESTPSDPDDFRRCYLLLKAVPQWKNDLDKLRPVSEVWNKLVDNWDRLTEMLETAMASPSKKATEMYQLMKSLGC